MKHLLDKLKKEQKIYLYNNDILNLNKVNKQIFELREIYRKEKENKKLKQQEDKLSCRFYKLCEKQREL